MPTSRTNLALSICRVAADISRRINARFARELRAGASFHVESAALSVDGGLRLGHRFVDSANGEVVTWLQEHWELSASPLTSQQRGVIAGRLSLWNGPDEELRPEPVTTDGFIPTARGRVKPGDVDVAGHFALGAIVHRCSNASGQRSAWMPLSCSSSGVAFRPSS